MDSSLPFIIAAIAVFVVIAILLSLSGRKGGSGGNRQKGRAAIIREASHKLSVNPHNPAGLIPLGELYFTEQLWDKAYPLYDTMFTIAPAHHEIDPLIASLRQGICAIKLNKINEGMKGLLSAYKLAPNNADVNYYLGYAFFKSSVYDKAIPLLKKTLMLNPEAQDVYCILGSSLYHSKHYRDSLPYLKRALDNNPEDKESLFNMADAMQESGMADKAMKIFLHLRPDPVFGARSCLACGINHAKNGQNDKAISDYEIGLRHENIPPETLLELRYRLAQCCFATNAIAKGIASLRQIQAMNPNYKDVAALLSRYQELSQNTNLQVFLSSGTSDFVALCRKFVAAFYKRANIKIMDISVNPNFTEILADIENTRWEDTEVFRFYRTTGSIGELFLRDFHARVRDSKADKGVCVTAGTFTEEAHKFIEGRPIDLVEKQGLTKVLKQIDMSN
ncbi:MAG: tetratricopeptide repeat protein [Treponema sp.]|nr:tetratricopeptide repeat protein [Treponema sp.]